ncbi:nitroreductase family deazaflavin-dependent oxidoreductase [Nocardia blacklockiae]|uniref:nitroreductase family deazaflavin-dependent oxidoreductase n=1 Tax=Nocardia blacklockiae TaxID=480036 RepID=UPI0018942953|nr:nitroreductase family deazaflavin-dependent oxidoreductase [Nocardia blacklockiae]MBF6176810.1 nitroreductase family deazaflavin-dependent oxidoreductase [Nocardia blacklockiae]
MKAARALARFNRVVTNPVARRLARWSPTWSILEHVGRRSGSTYRTPLSIFVIEDGFVVLIGYGLASNWVNNVLSAGEAVVEHRGQRVRVGRPALMTKHEAGALSPRPRLLYRLLPFDEAALVLHRLA